MTINKIAEMAGVSRATVSRYLNNGYVSQEKKEKIRAVIQQTGYAPSQEARTLRTKKTCRIGVIIPRINSDSISRMVQGMSRALSVRGYHLLLMNTGNSVEEELRCLSSVRENMVDGVIFLATIFTDAHRRILREFHIPVVVLGQRIEGFPCIYHDNRSAGERLGRMLGEKCKAPAFLGVTLEDEAAGQDRWQGVADGLRAFGIDPDRIPNETADFSWESGYLAAKALLAKAQKVDGIICATDTIAAGAIKYLHEQGLRVGTDIRIAGFGDSNISRIVDPELTTVHFYYHTSGEEAAKLILHCIENPDAEIQQLQIGYEIVRRASL